jgi:RNA polymerase sigma-70 factor, ECF subfamily
MLSRGLDDAVRDPAVRVSALRPGTVSGSEGSAMTEAAPLSFEVFFEEQHPRLFAALCLITGSREEAAEIAQDAFLRVLERWDRVAVMEDPTGFVFRIGMNLFRNRHRRARLLARLPIPTREHDDAFAVVHDRDVLIRAMRDLTPQQRAAVVLTAILDYSSGEAGRILGISDSTVRVLAHQGRVSMRSSVGEQG